MLLYFNRAKNGCAIDSASQFLNSPLLCKQTFQISATVDSLPELNETYSITLTSVSGGADLDKDDTVANVTILENNDPYGLLQLYYADAL